MRIRQTAAHELLAICKEWTLYFSEDHPICGSDGNGPDDEYRALYIRMSDAIEAADPDFWTEEYPRRDRERAA